MSFSCRVSHTTREPYFGEVNGSDYHFVSEEEFELLVQRVRPFWQFYGVKKKKFLECFCHP